MSGHPDYGALTRKLEEQVGGRVPHMGTMITQLAMAAQPCDITFYNRQPMLDVVFDPEINYALMYGAGAKRLAEMLSSLKLTNGDRVSLDEIWVINPMPKGGIPQEELDAVDLSEGDAVAGPNGETVREMIKNSYHCQNQEEEDRYLRRFLAS